VGACIQPYRPRGISSSSVGSGSKAIRLIRAAKEGKFSRCAQFLLANDRMLEWMPRVSLLFLSNLYLPQIGA
jgi:hypothetical protein